MRPEPSEELGEASLIKVGLTLLFAKPTVAVQAPN
jgi:hypothetical protein